jgi:hypothetical protein
MVGSMSAFPVRTSPVRAIEAIAVAQLVNRQFLFTGTSADLPSAARFGYLLQDT